MQTFLPYPDFAQSAACLDRLRLGKQRVEAYQILQSITNPNYGWQNHPAVKMWRGYDGALAEYALVCIDEWEHRGYKSPKLRRMLGYIIEEVCVVLGTKEYPPWLGNEDFHASHRSNLLRKDSEWYGQFGWTEPPNLPYVWPVT